MSVVVRPTLVLRHLPHPFAVCPALLSGIAACLARDPLPNPPDVTTRAPQITAFDVVCDPDGAKWTVTVETTAWTGGAASVWTVDGVYVESHDLTPTTWAEDGTWETMKLTLAIAEDWREVDRTNTVFLCGDDPSGVLELYDRDGAAVACRTWGPDPGIFATVADAPQCPVGNTP